MKKSRSTLQIVLIVLLFVSMLFAYQEYLLWQNQTSIETLMRNDQRFHDVQVVSKGISLILRGQVKSKTDLQSLYFEINQIKRVQIGSSVTVTN
jgi:quinol-cytochrome oxidoreductase complex cytochrome b subunit